MSQATIPSSSTASPLRERRLSNVASVLVGLFFLFMVIDAPLRYSLARIHLDALIYLPKMLMLVVVVLLPLVRPRASVPAMVVSSLVGLYLAWGMANLPSFAQSLFGLWVLVPLMFGLWAGAVIRPTRWRGWIILMFSVAAVGVVINPFVHYPWSGQTLSLLGQEINVSRQWTTFGVERYAGFGRASFNTASQLLLFGVMLVVLLHRKSAKLLVWFIAGAGITLTTSKGPLGAWLLVSIYFAGGALLRWPRYWIQLWLGVLAFMVLAVVLLPLSTLWAHYDPRFHGYVSKSLFASFGDRINWTWPASLHLLDMGGAWHWVIGRGVGGIGAAQQYFESNSYLPADNLFVYVVVCMGLPVALFLFTALWWRIVRMSSKRGGVAWRFPVILVLITYGVVVNVIEGGMLAFFLGLSMSAPNAYAIKINGRNKG